MPQGWVHAIIDLICYGRSNFDLHKHKDEPHKWLSWEHRRLRHKYYQLFKKRWSFEDPFPLWLKEITRVAGNSNKAEKLQSYVSHDYLDRIWDVSSKAKRTWIENFCMYLIRSPRLLRDWAGVDVKKGKIKRLIDGQEIWEDCPELTIQWENLKRYVKAVERNRNHSKTVP